MYIKKGIGYIVGSKAQEQEPYRVYKIGSILTLKEEAEALVRKNAATASIALQGFTYYQVTSNQGACEICEAHNGAIYPADQAREGVNLPPFHPNCKCSVQGFSATNPNADPWMGETLLWLDIMYSTGSAEDKARRLIEFYHLTELTIEIVAAILRSIVGIGHIGKRIDEFFRLLEMVKSEKLNVDDMAVVFHLPGVHFEGKPYPISPLEATIPYEWLDYAKALTDMLNIDYYLVLAFILHESGGNPMALNTMYSDPMQQATGLMQIIPYWHSAYQSGGQYYNNYTDVIAFAEQNGADINNLFDPLGNITIGIMMLNEMRKLCKDPTDMRELVGRQGEGYNNASTLEILYYRDMLAMQEGLIPWYSDEYYSSLMKS